MFSSYLFAIVASAVAVSAAPGLILKSTTPSVDIDGLENLKVTTTVTNTGNETLKLLNDPRGVLNPFPENTFSVIGFNGSTPSFNGAKVKYSPIYAASLDDPSVFTVLTPGGSIDIVHDLFAAYNFTDSGAGNYTIEPSTLFTYVGPDGIPKDFHADLDAVVRIKLSGNLAVSGIHDKRAAFIGCSATRKAQLNTAIASAQGYASKTYNYIKGISTSKRRYKTWFGTYTTSRKNKVQKHFQLISSRKFSSFTYDCTCTDPGTYAFVYANTFGKIYLCGAFWKAPNTGTDSKAGTLIHESSHFNINGGTSDYAYGQADAKDLAITNPSQAIFNADSHEYFAENNPAL